MNIEDWRLLIPANKEQIAKALTLSPKTRKYWQDRHKRDMDAIKAKYPELWEEAQKKFGK